MAVNFLPNHKLIKVGDYAAAATTAINSTAVNLSGYDGIVFLTSFGTANAANYINAAMSTASGGTFIDVAGSKVASGTSDEDVVVEEYRPISDGKWIRCEVNRGASTTCESIWAILYGPHVAGIDNSVSGTIIVETHANSASGTA